MANRRSRKKQSQLSFTPVPTSSPARSTQPEAVRHRAAFVSIDSPSSSRMTRTADMLPTPRTSLESIAKQASSPLSKRVTRSFIGGASSSPQVRQQSSKHSDRKHQSSPDESDSADDDNPRVHRSTGRKDKDVVNVESDSNEEDDEPVPAAASSMTNRNGIFTFDDSESDEQPVRSSPARRRLKRPTPTIETHSSDSNDENAPSSSPPTTTTRHSRRVAAAHIDDEDDLPVRPQKRQRRARRGNEADDVDDEEDEEEDATAPSRRRARRSLSSPTAAAEPRSERDQADLDSDLDFLGDADVESPRALRPGAASTKKQGRQNLLEALKRKRAKKEKQKAVASAPTGHIVIDNDNNEASSSSESEETESDAANDDWTYEEAGADEEFIDDEGATAADDKYELPLQFSRYATMKPLDHFKHVVEWMVQKKINPAFALTDDVYRLAFNKLNDYVDGMGSSKFQSSAWTVDFSKSLRGRPQIDETRVAASILYDRCEACNKSGHTPTYEVYFKGATYNRETLEEDSDDDESDDEAPKKPEVPGPQTLYRVGKYCMRNARQAHAFRHWKFHLNEWVIDCLKAEGELTAEKIVERDGWTTKKRRSDAERITDDMKKRGDIKALLRDFKNETTSAQNINNDVGRISSP